jgi:hypothetical protein
MLERLDLSHHCGWQEVEIRSQEERLSGAVTIKGSWASIMARTGQTQNDIESAIRSLISFGLSFALYRGSVKTLRDDAMRGPMGAQEPIRHRAIVVYGKENEIYWCDDERPGHPASPARV